MSLKSCHNVEDFKKLARKKLPSPIFHYIDGGSDDEVTLNRNTKSFDSCDLVPNVLTDVSKVDLSTTVFGQKIDFPLFLSPTAMHRLYHYHGESAAAKAADKMGTMFSMSTMSTSSIEEIANLTNLRLLWLGQNSFTGEVPIGIMNLNNLIEMEKDKLQSIGNEGRKNILRKFDVEKMCYSTFLEYKKLIK